jgi:hypothetical protein
MGLTSGGTSSNHHSCPEKVRLDLDGGRKVAAPVRPRPWSAREYAEWRGISESAAAQERYRCAGPPFIRIGGRVFYDPTDVYAWIDENKVR